ncbi:IS3 family transposase [Turicimonas muris]
MESFFGQLKSETYYRLSPVERSRLKRVDAQRMVESYIKWYNEERVQKSLGYQSPSEVILSYEALRLS